MPTYRRPRLLPRAIASALNQSRPDGRVAVYDNASGDETEAVVREIMARDHRVTYHRHDVNLGLVENLRFALSHVETPYFSILSDDDIVLPRFCEAALGALESNPDAGYASTRVVHADDRDRVWTYGFEVQPGVYVPPRGLMSLIVWAAPIWTGIIFRTSVLAEIGTLDPGAEMVADFDFQIRIAARRPFVVDGTPGAVFFHHRDSISGDTRLSGTWPGWLRLMANLAGDDTVPPEVRKEAEGILTEQLVARLYGVGVRGGRQGHFSDAKQAADLLDTNYGRHRRARLVRAFSFAFEHMTPFRVLYTWLAALSTPYQRSGWLRRPVTLAGYLAPADKILAIDESATGREN